MSSNLSTRGDLAWLAGILAVSLASATAAAEDLAPAEQNALIATHCTVCHNDTARNGGLSLARFDVERAQDSLIAVMLSKMTQGLSLRTMQSVHRDAAAKNLVATRMKGGAMLAAGVPPPPDPTTFALIQSLAARTVRAHDWRVGVEGPEGARVVTASVLREVSRPGDGEAAMYRLIATCNEGTREGELRLSWSPLPKEGTLMASVDDMPPVAFDVRGLEKMGNGLPGLTPPASVVLSGVTGASISRFPARRLVFTGLHGDAVEFSFFTLSTPSRRMLALCLG